jgi:glycerol-3-phosphate dehydrogenase (NAD(P)+)
MHVTVLGAGSWGTTLAVLLTANTHDVTLWSHKDSHTKDLLRDGENRSLLPGIPIPKAVRITSDLDGAVHGAEVIVAAVPSQFFRSVARRLTGERFGKTLVVNVAKGIENETLMLMSDVILDSMPGVKKENIATISGPSFAEEVSRRVPTAVVAASVSPATARCVQQTFMTPFFRVYSSEDIRGVELAGSIKNVIAIAAGVADGVGFGDNTKAAIMTRATAELSRLGSYFGANPRTFSGLSGIGDLIATCMSRHSRNRHVGEEIGKGRKLKEVLAGMIMVAEGVATTRSVHDLGRKTGVELPIVEQVYKILFEDKDPIAATSDLMTRDAKGEG